jgi:hypothetical protein
MYSFGTPSVDPIIDAFLSEGPPIEPFINEEMNARIASLQYEVNQLETKNARDEKRKKLSLKHIKEIQYKNPGMIANYIFSKEEDLSLEDLNKLFNELMWVQANITHQLHPLHHVHEPNTNGSNMPQNLMSLLDPSWDRSRPIRSSPQSFPSHHLPPQVLPPIPLPSTQQHTSEPHFPTHVPQTFQSAPPHLALHSNSLPQPITEQVQELPSPLQQHLQNYENPYNMAQPIQNYATPNPTLHGSVEASAQVVYSGINAFGIGGTFGYDNSNDATSNQPHQNDAYLGYNGTYKGHCNMEYDESVDVPPRSSFSEKDVNSHAWFGQLP